MVRFRVFSVILLVIFWTGGMSQDEVFSIETCATHVSQTLLVDDTASATTLAKEVNCSGGSFNATWRGSVFVEHTIIIPEGTTLNVTGEGSGAEINGGGEIRLFMAVGANLHISGLNLRNGNTTYGGAIFVTSSNVLFDGNVSLINNTANYDGGAVYICDKSSVSWNGVTSFVNNTARDDGGAMYADSKSTISWAGNTSFVNNMADNHGGALYLFNSTVSWDAKTSFIDNTANCDAGALYISGQSGVSWYGETSFIGNTASCDGGAWYIRENSGVLGYGETSFVNNMASVDGGAMRIHTSLIALWGGKMFFVNNTAVSDGGAMYADSKSTVSWAGNTSFVNNMADNHGGALYLFNSTVSWDAKTCFVDNTAGCDGGALYISDQSDVSWYGETSFIGNTASCDGGAWYIRENSSVSWNGETSFVNNMASVDGGAMRIQTGSNALWDGNTSFVNNTAGDDGGAIIIYLNAVISWDGNTSFVNNTAGNLGGALYVLDSSASWDGVTSFNKNTAEFGGGLYVWGSTVSWDGETSFVNNTVVEYGGALRGYLDSDISWDGMTSFLDNRAQYGGALAVYDNSIVVTWTGVTSFTANEAISDGGAIYATIGCHINVEGGTNFTKNVAAVDGGAVCLYLNCDDATTSYFIFENNPNVLFHGNTCGGNGGAIAFIGEVDTRFSLNMAFLENTAGVAGGAMYMSGLTAGVQFEGTKFISNSAVIGGGLYSTGSGSGTTVSGGGNETSDHNTTTTALIGCTFFGNKATRTGGAMDSGGGIDTIENTYFEQNTAIIGGALSLLGTSSLIGCEFIENSAYENGGPAISNNGPIIEFSDCNFVENGFICEEGNYLEFDDTGAQLDDSCTGCSIDCTDCTFDRKRPTTCVEALEHTKATGTDSTLESLLIDSGYWRATNTSVEILECYNSIVCIGGLTGDDDYCHEGYEGPYCSVCSEGYTSSLGFTCNKCDDNATGGIALVVILTVLVLITFAALASYMVSGKIGGADQSIVGCMTRLVPLHSVKIVIVVWQILTQFSTVANVVFPSVYQTFLDGVDILNFDFSWVLSIGCMIDTDFHDQLLLATLGPLVCMVILGGTYIAAIRRNRSSKEYHRKVRQKHVSMVLLLTFLIYSSVSSTLFKTFACDNLDDGKNYLRADYRIECDSSKHNALEIYAGFMVVLYVVGIPAFYGGLLYTNRKALIKNTGREEDGSIKPITDLWKPYRPERCFYEVVECVRRVLLTGVLVFIYPNTAAQIAVALMIAIFFMIVSEVLAPHSSPWDSWINRTGHAIVYSSMFLALLLKVDVTGEHASSQKTFESVLVAAHSCLILVVAIQVVAMVMALRKEVKEYPEPQMRRGYSQGVGKGGVFLEDEAPPSYEDEVENEEMRNPNQVMG